jgi:transcription elongation factor Elf1
MERIFAVVKKISDLKEDAEVEYFFQCVSCGGLLLYVKVPLNDEKGYTFFCGACGKSYPSL